jgi:hypothetical protein
MIVGLLYTLIGICFAVAAVVYDTKYAKDNTLHGQGVVEIGFIFLILVLGWPAFVVIFTLAGLGYLVKKLSGA